MSEKAGWEIVELESAELGPPGSATEGYFVSAYDFKQDEIICGPILTWAFVI